MVSGSSAGISLEGSGNISLNTENLAYTFVVTNEMLAAGGEHTFTLMEGSGSVIDNTYSSMIQSGWILILCWKTAQPLRLQVRAAMLFAADKEAKDVQNDHAGTGRHRIGCG